MPHILLNGLCTPQCPMHHSFMGRWAIMTSIWYGFVPVLDAILQRNLVLEHFGKFTKALLLQMYIASHSLVQPTNTTLVYLWKVESYLKILAKCKLGSEIHIDCMDALKAVKEIGRLTLDDARAVGNTSEPTTARGWRVGGCRRRGGPQSGWHHTPVHDHTMEKASQSVNEMCLDTSYEMGYDATSPLPFMSHDDASPSYRFAHGDTSQSPSMVRDDTYPPTSFTTFLLPTTRTSPPPTISTAPTDVHGRDEIRFMPISRRPTLNVVPPNFVHIKFIQTEILSLLLEASHIERA